MDWGSSLESVWPVCKAENGELGFADGEGEEGRKRRREEGGREKEESIRCRRRGRWLVVETAMGAEWLCLWFPSEPAPAVFICGKPRVVTASWENRLQSSGVQHTSSVSDEAQPHRVQDTWELGTHRDSGLSTCRTQNTQDSGHRSSVRVGAQYPFGTWTICRKLAQDHKKVCPRAEVTDGRGHASPEALGGGSSCVVQLLGASGALAGSFLAPGSVHSH